MKTSLLITVILFVTIIAQAQQSKTNTVNFDSHFEKINDIESSAQTNNSVNLFEKHTINKPVFKTEFSETDFDPIQFNTKLSASETISSNGELMNVIKETFSFSGKVIVNNKKYSYITGMTGNGIGMKLRL